MRISDWSSDVCSSDLHLARGPADTRQNARLRAGTADFELALDRSAAAEDPLLRIQGTGIRTPITISYGRSALAPEALPPGFSHLRTLPRSAGPFREIGRASCRERVCQYV